MDVFTAYLYGSVDNDIYMKVPEGLKCLKLKRSLYGLKQSGRMWYNRLSEYIIKEGYKYIIISPCVFIKRSISSFTIIAVYVNDLNIIGSSEEIEMTVKLLNIEFEMKDLNKVVSWHAD
jgi:Reverse transcriptase (RNA-dependent DNA polymerase)